MDTLYNPLKRCGAYVKNLSQIIERSVNIQKSLQQSNEVLKQVLALREAVPELALHLSY